MLRRFLVLACGLLCLASAPTAAQDTLLLTTIGQWQIRVDKTLGLGCFLLGSYDRGTVLRIGLDQRTNTGYVMVGNEAWRSLQVGNQYDLALRFDRASPWRGRATARRLGNLTFLVLTFDQGRFLVEVARRNRMTIYYNGDVVTQLPLRGTYAATQELLRCQRAADIARKQNRPAGDPFSSGAPAGGGQPPPGAGGGPTDDPAASSAGMPPGAGDGGSGATAPSGGGAPSSGSTFSPRR